MEVVECTEPAIKQLADPHGKWWHIGNSVLVPADEKLESETMSSI